MGESKFLCACVCSEAIVVARGRGEGHVEDEGEIGKRENEAMLLQCVLYLLREDF